MNSWRKGLEKDDVSHLFSAITNAQGSQLSKRKDLLGFIVLEILVCGHLAPLCWPVARWKHMVEQNHSPHGWELREREGCPFENILSVI